MEKPLQQIIGTRIREFRRANKYSIEELAHLAGMNPAHVAKIERGELNFTIGSLEKILTVLEKSYNEFFQFDEPVPIPANPLIHKTTAFMKELCLSEQEHVYRTAEIFYERHDHNE